MTEKSEKIHQKSEEILRNRIKIMYLFYQIHQAVFQIYQLFNIKAFESSWWK